MKQNSKKVTIDGNVFASKKEARRWLQLIYLQSEGEISELQLQVPFELIPAQYEQRENGKRVCIERSLKYVADFVYMKDGKKVVEDVKGWRNTQGGAYAKFVIKRKLMLYVFGIKILET